MGTIINLGEWGDGVERDVPELFGEPARVQRAPGVPYEAGCRGVGAWGDGRGVTAFSGEGLSKATADSDAIGRPACSGQSQ